MLKTDTPMPLKGYIPLLFLKGAFPTYLRFIFLSCILVASLMPQQKLHAQLPECAMTCITNLNVSLDAKCEAVITADMIVQNFWNPLCSPNGPQAFSVFVMQNGVVIPTNPKVTGDYIGQTLQVKVKHWKSGNTCWADIFIQDKMPPVLKCPPNITVTCNAPTDTAHAGSATATDCSGYLISYNDVYTNYGCNNPAGKIVRTWQAVDGNGMVSTCVQTITIKKTTIADVVFPKNLDDIQLPSQNCTNQNSDPSVTGYPTIGGYPLTNGVGCMVSATYSDQTLNICTGTKKILRTWTAIDWCTSQIKTSIQIIKIADKTPPSITCPSLITGNSYSDQCKGFANIPPATVSDDCSNFTVQVVGSWGPSIQGNGGVFNDIPIGTHTVTYYATDDCGSSSSCKATLKMLDNSPPVAVCDDFMNVSIGSNGKATVPAKTFDDGSIDNCCLGTYHVKRMEQPDSAFSTSIMFFCDDIGKSIFVVLRVTDCSGNSNSCMVQVTVQDKLPPSIICPPDVTTNCNVDLNDLTKFGTATVIDNCGSAVITVANNSQLSSCMTGLIKRTFTATSTDGKTSVCTQVITVVNNKIFTLADITWPKDYEALACTDFGDLEPDSLPVTYNKPILSSDKCSFVGVAHTDEVFNIATPACFKILRKWVVIDWCQYNPNVPNSPGRWEHTQLIKVFDYEKPQLICPSDVTVGSTTPDCSGAQVTLPPITATDCNPNITFSNSYNNGGANASGFYPMGTTTVIFSATDGCKNTATCQVKVTVTDDKKPSPLCLNGLSFTIMPSTLTATIWAKDFIAKATDNCTPESKLKITIKKVNSTTPIPPTDSSIVYTCDDVGTQAVEVWVCDEAGNCDFCVSFIDVQDNMKSCPPMIKGNIVMSGKVVNETGKNIEAVTLNITAPSVNPIVTGSSGLWIFTGLPKDKNYLITPTKDINPMNGVSTLDLLLIQKHILGLKEFDSPYKWIAGDIDKNGIISTKDMVDLRKLILQIVTKFPNNTSWRFIDGTYVFPDPKKPFNGILPESLYYTNVSTDMKDLNIMAIKIGDIDGSAKPSEATGGNEVRNGINALPLIVTDHKFNKGDKLSIPVKLEEGTELNALQYTLQFNEEVLEFNSIKDVNLNDWDSEYLNTYSKDEGLLSMAWTSLESYKHVDKAIYTLNFTAKQSGILSSVLELNNKLTNPLSYSDAAGETVPVLKYEKGNEDDIIMLYHNQPNPFSEETSIRFYISYPSDLSLNVYDLSGKQVLHKEGYFDKGQHSLTISKQELGQNGMYIYEIVTPKERVTDKMIMAE